MSDQNLKIAIVHDWLPVLAGAEKVLEQMLRLYPQADVYTLFNFLSDEDQKNAFGSAKITASYLNKWPGAKKHYRKMLPFCPQAIESFDLSEYDLILSSSHAVAKGVLTSAAQTHVSYVHSPTRYAWDLMHQYLNESNMNKGLKGYIAQYLLHKFRIWDMRTPNGVDVFLSNSNYIKRRIWKVYRREATTVYPPVDIDFFEYNESKDDFYMTASRMVPYKRIDLIAAAFALLPDKKLKIIGDGPEMHKVKKIAENAPNIEVLGYQSADVLKDHMQRAKAFVFAAEEDFGIVPVEAQACGTPVVAFGAGGATETVISYKDDPKNATGLFFEKQTPEALAAAIKEFDTISDQIKPENCRKNAESFSPETFRKNLTAQVDIALKENKSKASLPKL